MYNFEYQNPVKIIFGKGEIKNVGMNIPKGAKILLTYGGGSIFKNGVYDQVKASIENFTIIEFGGIEPNPHYETLMKAVEVVKNENITYLLSVGGGSVLDGTKFIAAAALFTKGDPWQILSRHAPVLDAIPIGAVLTLPATGSEMNGNSVVTKVETKEKLSFASLKVMPVFSILDPEVIFSLPEKQVANGIVDAFVHVECNYGVKWIDWRWSSAGLGESHDWARINCLSRYRPCPNSCNYSSWYYAHQTRTEKR